MITYEVYSKNVRTGMEESNIVDQRDNDYGDDLLPITRSQ